MLQAVELFYGCKITYNYVDLYEIDFIANVYGKVLILLKKKSKKKSLPTDPLQFENRDQKQDYCF